MKGRKRAVIVLVSTCAMLVASLVSTALTSSGGSSPDLPPRFAQDSEQEGNYLQLRENYIDGLRGVEAGAFANPNWRATAVRARQRQLAQLRQESSPTVATPWREIGPAAISNGQALDGSTIHVSGRVTGIAVDPTDANTVYLGTAQGGVWRSLDGGTTWTPIFDTAQSLSIGALALAPSNPHILYVGTGEANLSLDSFFGVGLYRIDNVDTTADLVGPINPSMTYTCNPSFCAGTFTTNAFTGRSISKILVSPTDPATIFVSTAGGGSGLGASAFSSSSPPLGVRGVYRSTNATSAAGSVTFTKLAASTGNSLDSPGTGSRSITDMTFVNNDPNTLVVSAFGAAAAGDGGIFRSTNALDPTPSFTQTLTVQSDHMAFATFGTGTVLAASDELISNPVGSGRLRESTDGGATWPTTLTAADGFCDSQCWYDIVVGIDPRSVAPNLRIYLGGSARATHSDGMKVSTDGGTTFTRDDGGLHADTHAIVFDSTPNPSTVWIGNDGGVWKRSATATGTAFTNLNNGLGTLQFQSLAAGKADAAFGIGGTQDNGTEIQQTSLGTWQNAEGGDGGYALIDQSGTSTSAVTMYHTFFNSSGSLIGFDRTNTWPCAKDTWEFRGTYSGQVPDNTPACDGTHFDNPNGIGLNDAVEFYAPMALGPGTPNTVYFGTNRLYRSSDRGDTMSVVSQAPINGSSPITTIGISPTNDNVRIVGLQNGQVWATTTGSSTLTQMTGLTTPANASGSSTNKWVGRAVVDPNNPNTAYVTFSYYAAGGSGLNVWKTTDLSDSTPTWTAASGGIPNVPVNALVVDPNDSTHLFAGTDIGVYASTDGGSTWTPFGSGLPPVAVFGMAIVQPGTSGEDLRVATHGRSMWEAPLSGTKLSQAISFGALADKTILSADFTVSATASSGLTVSFGATGNCSVVGSTVHITGVGSCTITASQGGDSNFNAAPSVPRTFAITKVSQTIAFGPLPNRTFGDADFAVAAFASSGLPVSFSATGSCSVSGPTVHLTGAGLCVITVSQAGNGTYDPATISQPFTIVKANQTISFAAIGGKTFGDADFTVAPTASSGLAVSLVASGNCSVTGTSVHITGAGSCTLTASQAGDSNYNAAASVSQAFGIAQGPQTITFAALADKTLGAPDFTAVATASSGLPVSFAASGSCTVSRATAHLTGVGTCTLTASQAGDTNYNAATNVSQSFAVRGTSTPKCNVPRVVGKALAAAKAALRAKHCATGKVTRAYSKKTKRGRVSSQSKRPGKVLAANTKVNLVVSKGRKP